MPLLQSLANFGTLPPSFTQFENSQNWVGFEHVVIFSPHTTMTEQNEEQQALAFFGVRKFHTEKFENSDHDSVLVSSPIESKGLDAAFAAFCAATPIEEIMPNYDED